MSDYLNSLAAKNVAPQASLHPRLSARFEPGANHPAGGPGLEEAETGLAQPQVGASAGAPAPGAPAALAQPASPEYRGRLDSPGAAVPEPRPTGAPVAVPAATTGQAAASLPARALTPVEPVTPAGPALTPLAPAPPAAVPPTPAGQTLTGHPTNVGPPLAALAPIAPAPAVEQPPVRREPAQPPAEPLLPAPVFSPALFAPPPSMAPAPEPTIHVTIGRIEVRANPPTARPQRQTAGRQPAKPMGLDEYLRSRKEGDRR